MSISTVALAALALTTAACSAGGAPAAHSAAGAVKAGGGSARSADGIPTAASTTTGPSTVTTVAQARRVFDRYVTGTDSALAAGNFQAALALTRSVPWHELNGAILAAKLHHKAVAPYRYGAPAFYIPAQNGSPQWFVASVRRTAPPGAPASLAGVPQAAAGQVLMLFEKLGARRPWQLTSSVQLQPGQQLPKLATTVGGDVTVAHQDNDKAYLARPDVTGPLQAAVVDDGPAAPAAAAVASGPLTTGLYQREAAAKPVRADVRQWYLQGSKYDRFALRTADGAALVFYTMYLNTTTEVPAELAQSATVKSGRPIPVPPDFVPLLARHQAVPHIRLKTQYDLTFAAIDPPASAPNAKIQVIGMGGAPSWISTS